MYPIITVTMHASLLYSSLFDTILNFYDFFISFSFIYGDHACISSILQVVSLLKILIQCWFVTHFTLFHIRWPCMHLIYTPDGKFSKFWCSVDLWLTLFHIWLPCMHLIYTPGSKFAQNLDAVLISDFFLSFSFYYGDYACISSTLQSVSLLKTLMQCRFMTCFPSCFFIYGDHACISSILQSVSLSKTLIQCWFYDFFLSFSFISFTIQGVSLHEIKNDLICNILFRIITVTLHASQLYSSL